MVHSVNGRADIVGPPIQLGDFFPEKRAVVINGQSHEAWVTTNRRYPRPIQAQLDRYRNRYQNVVAPLVEEVDSSKLTDQEKEEMALQRQEAMLQADNAYQQYVTDSLMALIPTLDEETANLIDQESSERVLVELGYFSDRTVSPAVTSGSEEANDDRPLTGGISTPDSPDSIPATQSIDS